MLKCANYLWSSRRYKYMHSSTLGKVLIFIISIIPPSPHHTSCLKETPVRIQREAEAQRYTSSLLFMVLLPSGFMVMLWFVNTGHQTYGKHSHGLWMTKYFTAQDQCIYQYIHWSATTLKTPPSHCIDPLDSKVLTWEDILWCCVVADIENDHF